MNRVLVTGGTGFIGRALVPWLLARGWAVRVAVRRADAPLPVGAEACVVGDIGPATDWRKALAGVERVVHLAGRAHILREEAADPEAEFRRVNTEGTLALARAAGEAGVRRLVFVSSVKAVAEEGTGLAAAFEAIGPATPYGRSKRAAEDGLRAAGGVPEVVIVRPHLVHGPGVGANVARLMTAIDRGWPLPLGGIDNRRGLLFVDNLVDFLGLALDHPNAAGRIYTLHDGEAVSTPELVRRLAAALGRPARLVPVPPALIAPAARLLGRQETWRSLAGSLALDDDGPARDLGWRPPVPLDEGLRRTAAGWRENLS